MTVQSIDARTGAAESLGLAPSTPAEVRAAAVRAHAAAGTLAGLGRSGRAALLRALAEALEAEQSTIVATADRETALGDRLNGELTRTVNQLRFFADVITDGAYLEVSIDHERTDTPLRVPDLRRLNVPLGPVAVFGSSNFPLAFGAAGGDTASALAAGCPVIVKAHSSHPGTTSLVERIVAGVLAASGLPDAVFQVVYGRTAGTELVTAPEITAVGFTGSLAGGRALADLAASRPTPIPFFGELGSINPVVVLPGAATARADQLGTGFAESMTMQAGQMCTKPGVVLVPAGTDGDRFVAAAAARLESVAPAHLLNDSTRAAFRAGAAEVLAQARVVWNGDVAAEREVAPVLAQVDAATFTADPSSPLLEEHFGPLGVIVRYADADEARLALAVLPPALTGTLHATGDDLLAAEFAQLLADRSGRVVFGGFPTGVAVTWSMTHGGQYPSSTSQYTSVGASAIRRWLRPVTLQDAPSALLPAELRDEPAGILRRIDGVLAIG